MKKAKRIIALFAAVTMVAVVPTAAYANDINVTVDGTQVTFADQAPVIVDGRTLVPVRGVFEQMGFTVDWNDTTRQATLTRAADTVIITADSAEFTTNGVSHALDVPAQLINDRTMLPIRAVLESVGYYLDWMDATRTVVISSAPPTNAATIGEIIQFGGWDWRVLDVQGNYALILTENIIETRAYHNIGGDIVTWETSDVRAYLNGEFFSTFNEADRVRIRETYVVNNDNPWGYSSGGNNTRPLAKSKQGW